jgi:hypothetical protein
MKKINLKEDAVVVVRIEKLLSQYSVIPQKIKKMKYAYTIILICQ